MPVPFPTMSYQEPMLKDGALNGRTILVTGGGTGLGKAMATYFRQLGAQIVIASRKQEVLDAAASELRALPGAEVLPLACDVRDYEAVEQMLEQALTRFGRIDAVVNNAAGNFVSPTERLSAKAFETVIGIVLQGTANVTLAAGKRWIAAKQPGVFLNIVTTYASTGSGYVAPSACAKAGVLALTRSLAVEWAKYGIRSNAIAPGPFPTKGAWDRLFPENVRQILDPLRRIPLRRTGEHQELANLAAYLVSDFSAFINGEVVTIDGGEWLQGAGEFNHFDAVPAALWDQIERATRGGKSAPLAQSAARQP